MMREISPDLPWASERWAKDFGLENGYNKLARHFQTVDQFEYDNNLHLRADEPILTYLRKTMKGTLSEWVTEHENQLRSALNERQAEKGYIRLTPKSGFFIAHRG
jgi:hypothetical protein